MIECHQSGGPKATWHTLKLPCQATNNLNTSMELSVEVNVLKLMFVSHLVHLFKATHVPSYSSCLGLFLGALAGSISQLCSTLV